MSQSLVSNHGVAGAGAGAGDGDGDGDGNGDGYGDGYGTGTGDGDGDGNGYGAGDGYGYGYGGGGDGTTSGSGIFYRDGVSLCVEGKSKSYTTRDGHVVEEYTSEGKRGYFVTLEGTYFCAHGETLDQAIADATWKDESKRPSLEELRNEINEAGKNRKISLNEFRIITGACSEGCRIALKRAKLDGSPMTLLEIKQHFNEWGSTLERALSNET